ncbi:Alpha/Beta hydrolase protein [Hypoxylon sp. FL1150]|nr:Alpha/Beta hydrolase protein [Hypoxylon sp. FL1150]
MNSAMATSEKLKITEYRIESEDGCKISVWRIADEKNVSNCSPAIVYAHGGAFVLRPVDMNNVDLTRFRIKQLGRGWFAETDVVLFYVSYRLADEKSFPTAANDVYAALRWASANAPSLNINKDRIGLMGVSAGGNLALTAALRARDDRLSLKLCGLMLVYPMLNPDTEWENHNGSFGISWVKASMEKRELRKAWSKYLAGADDLPDEQRKYSKLLLADFTGLPRTYVDVGTQDYFLEEDIQLAEKMKSAGVNILKKIWEGMPHGFEGKRLPDSKEGEALAIRRDWWAANFRQ